MQNEPCLLVPQVKWDWAVALRWGIIGAVAASLCCFTPVLMVMGAKALTAVFGPQVLDAASNSEITLRIHTLTDRWYDDHKWGFRIFGLIVIALGLGRHFWRHSRGRLGIRNAATLRRCQNQVARLSSLTVVFATGVYLVWNYVILHYWGKWLGLPW